MKLDHFPAGQQQKRAADAHASDAESLAQSGLGEFRTRRQSLLDHGFEDAFDDIAFVDFLRLDRIFPPQINHRITSICALYCTSFLNRADFINQQVAISLMKRFRVVHDDLTGLLTMH